MTRIESTTFGACKSLKSIELPEEIEEIGYMSFGGCEQLKEVQIPDGVTEIAETAFKYCTNLENVEIPNTVQKIAGNSFENTPWYENRTEEFVLAGDNVLIKYNGDDATIEIPEGVRYIGSEVFEGKEKVETIIVPKSVKEVAPAAFFYNDNLRSIVLENDNVILAADCIIKEDHVLTIVSPQGSTGQRHAEEYGEKLGIRWMELK